VRNRGGEKWPAKRSAQASGAAKRRRADGLCIRLLAETLRTSCTKGWVMLRTALAQPEQNSGVLDDRSVVQRRRLA